MDATHPQHDLLTDVRYADEILKFYQHLDQKLDASKRRPRGQRHPRIRSRHSACSTGDVFLNEWLKQEGLLADGDGRSASAPAGLAARPTRQRISRTLQRMGLAVLERRLRTWLGDRKELLPAHERAVFPAVD